MKTRVYGAQRANGLVVVVSIVATILALLGAAVSYTVHISRLAQRSRKTALAMEIADGHLEFLFANWRNIYRTTWTTTSIGATDNSVVGTNFFYTDMYNPGPAPTPIPNMNPAATPPIIPLPAKSNFPTEANYTVSQYRIQAVDPMIDLDASENALKETSFGSGNFTALSPSATPPPAYGPNTWQYSYFYLAAADVSVPAIGTSTGTLTAKVRRVFEKKFDNPWTYAMFYADDLELQPSSAFALSGRIQTNGSLYIGTSNLTAQSAVTYSGDYVNGYAPNDPVHSGAATAPTFPAGEPPAQVSPYLPFGWNLQINNADGSSNNDSYHELIERPAGGTDQLANVRLYNQAGYRVLIDASNNVTITNSSGAAITNGVEYNDITGAITTNQPIQDNREGTYVRLTTVDIGSLISKLNQLPSWNGVIYFSDTSAGTAVNCTLNGTTVSTTKRGIRLKNGASLPSGGMTVAAENPVYIQGDYNTGGVPPSDSGTFTSPTVNGYTRTNSAVIADAINVLSGAWLDTNSTANINSRIATSTTVNAALVTGNVPTSSIAYSGGGENFVRFLEDWNKNSTNFTYYGSMVELFASQQGIGKWNGAGNVYKSPGLHWYYDTNFGAGSPPGKLSIAAYLQQQRWYQVY
jgi:hypothetical protein